MDSSLTTGYGGQCKPPGSVEGVGVVVVVVEIRVLPCSLGAVVSGWFVGHCWPGMRYGLQLDQRPVVIVGVGGWTEHVVDGCGRRVFSEDIPTLDAHGFLGSA